MAPNQSVEGAAPSRQVQSNCVDLQAKTEVYLTAGHLDFILWPHKVSTQWRFEMALIRWEPARELHTMQNEMNRLFNTFFDSPSRGNGVGTAVRRRWIPAMDVVQTEDHFVLRADLPGLSESDVKI